MADHTSPGDSYAVPAVDWDDPALNGIDRIQYYATSGDVVCVAERPMPVTLVLTREEAQTLTDILSCVGGPPNSRRKHSTSMLNALCGRGFHFARRGSEFDGSIHFQAK